LADRGIEILLCLGNASQHDAACELENVACRNAGGVEAALATPNLAP
jgi:hypothetical protein